MINLAIISGRCKIAFVVTKHWRVGYKTATPQFRTYYAGKSIFNVSLKAIIGKEYKHRKVLFLGFLHIWGFRF